VPRSCVKLLYDKYLEGGVYRALTNFGGCRPPNMRGGAVNIHNVTSTRVLVLMNMLSIDDLKDDDEYEEIVEDIRDECVKYGEVLSVEVPRPVGDGDQAPGVGKVYVEFEKESGAEATQSALSGRKFDNRVVVTSFLSEEKYKAKDFA